MRVPPPEHLRTPCTIDPTGSHRLRLSLVMKNPIATLSIAGLILSTGCQRATYEQMYLPIRQAQQIGEVESFIAIKGKRYSTDEYAVVEGSPYHIWGYWIYHGTNTPPSIKLIRVYVPEIGYDWTGVKDIQFRNSSSSRNQDVRFSTNFSSDSFDIDFSEIREMNVILEWEEGDGSVFEKHKSNVIFRRKLRRLSRWFYEMLSV